MNALKNVQDTEKKNTHMKVCSESTDLLIYVVYGFFYNYFIFIYSSSKTAKSLSWTVFLDLICKWVKFSFTFIFIEL